MDQLCNNVLLSPEACMLNPVPNDCPTDAPTGYPSSSQSDAPSDSPTGDSSGLIVGPGEVTGGGGPDTTFGC